jgi:hypothetical protein
MSCLSGLSCSGGLAAVEPGYYAYEYTVAASETEQRSSGRTEATRFATVPCPVHSCPGAPFQQELLSASELANGTVALFQCPYPRLNTPDNALCGRCANGFIPWSDGECAECDGPDKPWLAGVLLLSFAVILSLFLSSFELGQGAAGYTDILLYFVQISMLMVGSVASSINWLRALDLSPASIPRCIADISPYQLVLISLFVPLLLLAELLVIAAAHSVIVSLLRCCCEQRLSEQRNAWQCHQHSLTVREREREVEFSALTESTVAVESEFTSQVAYPRLGARGHRGGEDDYSDVDAARSGPTDSHTRTDPYRSHAATSVPVFEQGLMLQIVNCYTLDRYVQGVCRILLFSFSGVATCALKYLYCIDVGTARVVYSMPAINCHSSDYHAHMPIVVLMLLVFILGFPFASILFLTQRRDIIHTVTAAKRKHDALWEGIYIPSTCAPTESYYMFLPANAREFADRWSVLMGGYSAHVYYWQSVVLLRRVVFAIIDALLATAAAERFLLFGMCHLLFLLLQSLVRPFDSNALNRAELFTHVLMSMVCLLLSAGHPPYSEAMQGALFCCVGLPSIGLLALVLRQNMVAGNIHMHLHNLCCSKRAANAAGRVHPYAATALIQVKQIAH